MAKCPNKNTEEYKALQEVYKSEIATNNIINSWQDANNTDVFPTVVEAKQFVKYNKVAFALKQKSFAESLLNNLREQKLIHSEFGLNLINVSDPNVFYTNRVADPVVVESNRNKIIQYLKANNIPLEAVSIIETKNTYSQAESKQTTQPIGDVKKGVSELFDSNPELANAVYEALGFGNNLPLPVNKEIEFLLHTEKLKINLQDITLEEEGNVDLNLKDKWNTFAIKAKGKKLGYIQVKYKDDNTVKIGLSALYEGKEEVKQSIISKILDLINNIFKTKKVETSDKKINVNAGKGVGKLAYELLAVKLKREYQKDLLSDTTRSDYAENLWKSFEKQGKAEVIGKTDTQYRWDYYYKFNVDNQITPQQKQQAIQLYSQYLDSVFPNSKVKEVLYHMTSTAGKKGIEQKGRFLKPGEQGYQKSDYVTTGGIYFTDNNFYDEDTQMYGSPISGGYGSAYVSAILNIKNPLIDLNKSFGNISQVELKNYDGFVGTNEAKEIGVLEPEQIHILGNKQDLQQFKEFIDGKSVVKENIATTRVEVNENVFTPKDILPLSRSWDTPRSRAVVMHLKRMFPQIQVKMLSVANAEILYNSLPKWQKSSVNFKQVNSFYVDGVAYLVKGRVTDETAIEEMLHPFIDAIKVDNPELFNGLLVEAKINFPEMVQSITEAYNDDRNFSALERDLEIVTQALSRHFNKEYETTPTKRFLDKIKEALDWFVNVINNLNEYITGKPLSVKDINNKTTFSDVAKLLNTEGIRFKLESRADAKVRYSLSPEKQKIINKALDEANPIQTEIIKRLFHVAISSKEEIDSLSANLSDTASANTIVVLNKEDHTYVDITNREIYKSVTTAIKGQLANEEDVQLNLAVGNDIDALLDAIISKQSFDDVFPQMKVFDKDIAGEMFEMLEEQIKGVIPVGSIPISQVVVFDEATKLAGTADLVVIDKNGKIRIVDLKTSKNSILEKTVVTIKKNKVATRVEGLIYELKEYELKEDVPALDAKGKPILNSDGSPKIYLGSDLKKIHGVNKLSTEGQHNLQVNIYKRMFENMGYTVYEGDGGAKTFHILVDIVGKGTNQVFNKKFAYEGIVEHSLNKFSLDGVIEHPASQNLLYVDMLVPSVMNNTEKESLDRAIGNAEDAIYRGDQDVDALEKIADTIDAQQYPEYNTIFDALQNYSMALVEQDKALDRLKTNVYRDKTKAQTRDDIASTLAYIASNINTGPIARSQTYTNLLRASLNQMQKFTAYVEDPANVNKPEYITYALNFNRFLSTFEALYSIKDSKELNATQRTLVLQMQLEQNKLLGTNGKEGLINDAIINYVKEIIRTRSTNDWGGQGSAFTEDMLDDLLVIAPDIAMDALNVQDMATQKDTILAVMDKIYKSQKQLLLDKIAEREISIRTAGNELLKLSGNKDLQSLYDFMLEYDKDGQFTGFYTQKIGQQYYSMQQSLRSELYDDNGNPYEYRDVSNLDKAKPEDIKYNIELAKKKQAFSKFFEAESVDANGELIDGEFHRYTDEFINARKKYEYWVPSKNKEYGTWYKKDKTIVSARDYAVYQAKYYNFSKYTKALRVNGEPTGKIEKDQELRSPKVQFRVAREISESGQDMRSKKYAELMDPTKTDALSIAQRNFYNMFIKYYETELLNKLPQGIKDQMAGRVPIVKNNILDTLKDQPNVVTKMYAATVRSIKNFTQETATQKNVLLDEQGNFVNSLPIFYTGKLRVDEDLKNVETEITALKDKKKKGLIGPEAYKAELAILNGKAAQLRTQPSLGELNKDMTNALLKFSAMAEHYEVMGEIEDTLTAMVKVIENRTYTPADPAIVIGTRIDSKFKKVGTIKGADSNALRRAKKYMSMIYYDNELVTKGMIDKIADELIGLSSLSYVAFNPFGNLNNYVMGRINNGIEMLGSRHFSKQNYARSSKEYNTQGIAGLLSRTSAALTDIADIATLGKTGLKKADYDANKPNNKYEAFVDMFRMMDKATDIRENTSEFDSKSIWSRFKEWGYVIQDAAEYNVQTKVGIAMLMDVTIKNSSTGETLSFYDAFQYNAQTHENELMSGYDTIVNKNGSEQPYTDQFRYDLRNQIREVNKQIHGNYAKEDRMVIQGHTLGNLATQFHKWVAPAIRSRLRREYFDQNLGWLEGRYRSFFKFLNHVKGEMVRGNVSINPKNYNESFKEAYGFTGQGGNLDQKAEDKLRGFYRTTGELGIMLSVFVLNSIMAGVLAGDDDDKELTKRLKNLIRLQGDRTYKEMLLFTPTPEGLKQQYALMKSPIATTRTLGELGEAISLSYMTPLAYLYQSNEDFYANSEYVYQNKPNKGKLKVYKNWADVVPILYSIQKWDNMIKAQEFYIK